MVKAIKAAQLADQLRDYIASWSIQDLAGYLFSITQVTLSPDLFNATVWVDVLNPADEKKILRLLNLRLTTYQRKLRQSLQRQVVPKIYFKLDNGAEINDRFDQLLKQ